MSAVVPPINQFMARMPIDPRMLRATVMLSVMSPCCRGRSIRDDRDGSRSVGRMSDDAFLQPYRDVVDRVTALTLGCGEHLDDMVPACPDWTARQVVAHLAGLAHDWVDGRLDGYGSDAWAQDQVDRFAGHAIEEVLASWATAVDRFGSLPPSPIGGTPAMWAFGDAVVHEADLRPVIQPATRVPDDAHGMGLKTAIARWRSQLATAGVAPLDIVATGLRTWRVGDSDAVAERVETTSYELFRALFGRRSRPQVEAWAWSTDPAPYLDAGLPFPFSWATADLVD